MSRRTRAIAGFTLVEMMVAVVIGTIGVIVAAKVAQVVIRQSTKGRQSTDFRGRTRLVTRQLRADMRSAGVGSTGLVAVDRNIPVWGAMRMTTPAGFDAIPVVAGANNIAAMGVGGANTVAGSDAVQLVVPDPSTAVRAQGFSPANQDVISLDPLAPAMNCPNGMIFVADYSAPTGAGRTQILFVDAYPPNAVNTTGNLQFTVGAGSDVMCARVSVYWVDDAGWLHRSDMSGPAVPLINLGGPVFVDPANVAADVLAPGILDMQIAYRVSSEVYVQNAQVPPIGQPERTWIFEGVPGNADVLMNNLLWSEVRLARVNLLARTLRRIQEQDDTFIRTIARREDAAALPPLPLTRALAADWVTATEALTNLRYFDYGAPSGITAEPY